MKSYVWKVTKPEVWVDRSLPTASWWNEYVILPGEYPVEFTNTSGSPYVEGKVTPGYVADVGPDYAVAKADVVFTRSHVVNRLFTESRAETKVENLMQTKWFRLYAYEVTGQHGVTGDLPVKNWTGPKAFAGIGEVIEVTTEHEEVNA